MVLGLLAAEPKEKPLEVVTPDGGEVPTVAPKLTEKVAPALAPELVPDGGEVTDGGVPVVVTEPTLSVYDVKLPIEATMTATMFGLYLAIELAIKPTLEGDVSCRHAVGNGRCDPADLSGLDRYSVGRKSPGWAVFSDVGLAVSLLAPIFYLGLESIVLPTTSPWLDFADDLLVVGESMALASAFQVILKFAFRRPRPVRYTMEGPQTSFDAELSFPSGHTMLVAAATTTLTTTVFFRHPTAPMRWVVLGAGALLTVMTAFARVESGYHFPTDVMVGSFLGAFSGFLIPYLHRKKLPVMPSASVSPSTGATSFSLVGTF